MNAGLKRAVSLFGLLFFGIVFAGMEDTVLRFSSPGPDRYADGSRVLDGECYALVWSPKGTAFAGFNADGTVVSAADRVVLAAPLAENGKCRDALFQVPAAEYDELKNGEWAVCLVDTRNVHGVPAGVWNGKPLRVNRWGIVKSGVKVEETSKLTAVAKRLAPETTRADASSATVTSANRSSRGIRANVLSAVPDSVKANPPRITGIDVSEGVVKLTVADTVPFLTYTISSGSKPNSIWKDYAADIVDGDDGAEIEIETDASGDARFFKVMRVEK